MSQLTIAAPDTSLISYCDYVCLDNQNEDNICRIIEKSWIETQNGLNATGIAFSHSHLDSEQLLSVIQSARNLLLSKKYFFYPIRSFIIPKGNIVLLFSFHRNDTGQKKNEICSLVMAQDLQTDDVLQTAIVLSRLADDWHPLTPEIQEILLELSRRGDYAIGTLAAEVITQHGTPTIPAILETSIWQNDKQLLTTVPTSSETLFTENSGALFEDRIDVHSYNFFEYVHPAYARQVVTMARFIRELSTEPGQIIDVGTGTGAALAILLDLIPSLEVLAVEPSPLAFQYLKNNMKHLPNVCPYHGDFLGLELVQKTVEMIISTGASHHFNTCFFFQKAAQLLTNNGVLIVADEFISSYKTRSERDKNLILHHAAYMISILFSVPDYVKSKIDQKENNIIKWFSEVIPFALFNAVQDNIVEAKKLLRELLHKSEALNLGTHISHPLMAFFRLQLLELEAMVAGFDYEVEQKTSPERFIEMSKKSGFKLLTHERVFATDGDGKLDAGTHVMVFRKVAR
ncbi:class I SAM-dependent methyltransferase [Nostoc sp. UHCC 0702]|nr:class I SAM-dependent methyltransferase [Nostoc sp. UHCC 0702]